MNFSELKENARNSLKGHYKDAIIMTLVVALVSGIIGSAGVFFDYIFKTGATTDTVVIFGQTIKTTTSGLFVSIFSLVATSVFVFGMLNFYLKISRNEEASWKDAFGKTNMFFDFIAISLLVAIFTTLWSLLLIIPGIIAAYAYTQVYLVKLDNPDMGWMDLKKVKN